MTSLDATFYLLLVQHCDTSHFKTTAVDQEHLAFLKTPRTKHQIRSQSFTPDGRGQTQGPLVNTCPLGRPLGQTATKEAPERSTRTENGYDSQAQSLSSGSHRPSCLLKFSS